MKRQSKLIVGAAIVGAVGIAGTVVAIAAGGDTDTPISGPALEKAKAAALAHTGGGVVIETEVGDEESLYEVEVRMPDGTQIDVQLDVSFNVVGQKADAAEDGTDAGPRG
ncbi:MAG: PepSY domain-containing protein [Actinomycetota bacterium]